MAPRKQPEQQAAVTARAGRKPSSAPKPAAASLKPKPLPRLSEDRFHAISRALADPRRFAILKQIASASSVTCAHLDQHKVVSPATISHHMSELQAAGLIGVQRKGRIAHLTLIRPVLDAYRKRLAAL